MMKRLIVSFVVAIAAIATAGAVQTTQAPSDSIYFSGSGSGTGG